MELYIVRHGETTWNAAGKLQGSSDIELTSQGREIAGRLGRDLEETPIDVIYSSPLIRAYETASLIRGHRNIPIIRDPRLTEAGFGLLEGSHFTNITDEKSPYSTFFRDPAHYIPAEGGETFESVRARTASFIQEVIEPLYGQRTRIMIVAHGTTNQGLINYLDNFSLAEFWKSDLMKNCEVLARVFDGTAWHP